MKERLQKYLSCCGVASRRKSEELITSGLIKINGKIANKLGTKVDPKKDTVEYKGRIISPKDFVYYLLYKPKSYTSTVSDPHTEKIVVNLLPKTPAVYPVGRLDKDSEGLLLLTNDGEFAQKVSHPSHSCEKEYQIVIGGELKDSELRKLEKGVSLKGKKTAPVKIMVIKKDPKQTMLNMILKEGRNRQIRRMFPQVNHEVIFLKRTRIGKLILGELKKGEYRKLTPEEIKHIC